MAGDPHLVQIGICQPTLPSGQAIGRLLGLASHRSDRVPPAGIADHGSGLKPQ
jgi:hypothetical protein